MNILTKISIVVLVVLSLFVSAVFITIASVVPNYKQKYDAEKSRADSNELAANIREAAAQRLAAEISQATANLDKAGRKAQEAQDDFDGKLLKVTGELDKVRRDNVEKQVTTDLQAAAVNSLSERLKAAADDLKKARESNDALAKENMRVTQLYQETTAQLERQVRQGDFFAQQIVDLQKQLEEARKTRPTAGEAKAEPVAGSTEEPRYKGTITSVKNDLAQINIGSSNGVKVGDKLFVYREGKLLGYLTVSTVDANASAGVLTDRQAEINQGDNVTNRL